MFSSASALSRKLFMRSNITRAPLSVIYNSVQFCLEPKRVPPADQDTKGRCYLCDWKKNRSSQTRCRNCKFFICKEHSAPARCVNCIQGDEDMDVTDGEWVSSLCNREIKKKSVAKLFWQCVVFHYMYYYWLLHLFEQDVNVFIYSLFSSFFKTTIHIIYLFSIHNLQILFSFKKNEHDDSILYFYM